MQLFAETNPNYTQYLFDWLTDLKVIERKVSDNYIKYKFNEDGLSDAVIDKLQQKMNEYGISYDAIDADYARARQDMMDVTNNPNTYAHGDRTLTQDQFFNTYFVSDRGNPIKQNKISQESWISNLKDSTIRNGAISDGIGNMGLDNIINNTFRFKKGDTWVLGKDIDPNSKEYLTARDDVVALLQTQMGNTSVPVVHWSGGRSEAQMVSMQHTHLHNLFERMGITLHFASGSAINFDSSQSYMQRRMFSIFEADSTKLSKEDRRVLEQQKQAFLADLDTLRQLHIKSSKNGNEKQPLDIGDGAIVGMDLFEISNSMQPILIHKSQLKDLITAYEDFIKVVKDPLNPDGSKKSVGANDDVLRWLNRTLEDMKLSPTKKTEAHVTALRQMIFADGLLVEAGDYSDFIRILNDDKNFRGDSAGVISKRLSLYHTPNFKNINDTVTKGAARNAEQQVIVDKYLNRGTAGVALWDDKAAESILRNLQARMGDAEGADFWDNVLNARGDETPFDSISYISHDYMKFLSIAHGRSSSGETQIFKPAITSTGDVLLMGKTVFVYDPEVQRTFFDTHSDADILLTKSGAKITGAGWEFIPDKHSDFEGNNYDSFVRQVDIHNIKIKQDRIHQEDIGKLSQSSWNYLDSNEAGHIFRDFYGEDLEFALKSFKNIMEDSSLRRLFFQEGMYEDQTLSSLFHSDGGTHLAATKLIAALDMDPLELGRRSIGTQLFKRLLDPVINQSAMINGKRFGGKAVLIQSMDAKLRDLSPTIWKDGKTREYGEVYIPWYEMDSSLSALEEDGMTIKIIDKSEKMNHKIISIEDLFEIDPDKTDPTNLFGGPKPYLTKEQYVTEDVLVATTDTGSQYWTDADKTSRVKKRKGKKDELKPTSHKTFYLTLDEAKELLDDGMHAELGKVISLFNGAQESGKLNIADDAITVGERKFNQNKAGVGLVPVEISLKDGVYSARYGSKIKSLELQERQVKRPVKVGLGSDLTLGQLHSLISSHDKGQYQIGVISTRYPRTRPNDMTVLGLKGFLDKDYGNAMIVNELDVLNIFEGDYDVDKNDYFFSHSKAAFDHIQKMDPLFTQGIDPGKLNDDGIKGLQLIGENNTRINNAWREQIGNGTTLKKGIGVVQKMNRGLSWLADLGEDIPVTRQGVAEGQTEKAIFFTPDGSRIVMDYDATDWWFRNVLETQAIIDAGTSTDGDVMRFIRDYSMEFLFPSMHKSDPAGKYKNKKQRIGFLNEQKNKPEDSKRIRLFRKLNKDGKEVEDLNDLDKDIIITMMHCN